MVSSREENKTEQCTGEQSKTFVSLDHLDVVV